MKKLWRVWLLVREPADARIYSLKEGGATFVMVRGAYGSKEAAQKAMQEFWDAGERPQCRVEEYLVNRGERPPPRRVSKAEAARIEESLDVLGGRPPE